MLSVFILGEWILTAWERIPSESTVTGFEKCCIYNALDNTENDSYGKTKKIKRVIVKNMMVMVVVVVAVMHFYMF
jgi:hypothetical protein